MRSQLKTILSERSLFSNLSKNFKKLLFLTMSTFLLTACGGGGGLPDRAPADVTGPIVLSIEPASNAVDVPVGNQANAITAITFIFDEKLDQASVLADNIKIREVDGNGDTIVNSEIALDSSAPIIYIETTDKVIVNVVKGGFKKDTTYDIEIKNFYDTLGNLILVYNSRFSTSSTPSIISLSPVNDIAGDIPVSLAQKITVEFDEVMDDASLRAGFKLTETQANATSSIVYTFNDANLVLLLDHQIVGTQSLATYSLVEPNTQTGKLLSKTARYTINLSATITDLGGNKIVPLTSTFKTGVSSQLGSIPVKPGIVTATTSNDTVTFKNVISWPVANNVAYNLYVSKNDGDFTQVITTPTPLLASSFSSGVSINDNNVTAGTRYKYAVTAMNVISINNYGPESIFSYSGEVVPSVTAVPQNLSAIAGPSDTVVDGTVSITWDAVGNNRYKLYESSDAGKTFNSVLLNNTTSLSHSYTPSSGNDVQYQYGLTIVNPDTTESVMIKSAIVVPFGALANVTAQGDVKKVLVTWPIWKNVPRATYNVYVKVGTSPSATFSTIPIATNLTTGSFIHGDGGVSNPALPDSTSYTYGVVTVSNSGTANPRIAIQKNSNLATTSTPIAVPAIPSNINTIANDGSVTLTWDVATNTNGVSLNYDYSVLQKTATEAVFTQVALVKNPVVGNGKATVLATNNISHSYKLVAFDNTIEGITSPGQIVTPRLKGSQISAWNHSCVINSGEIWCWGDNTYGQLGNATQTSSYAEKQLKVATPTTGRVGTSWIAVSTGSTHTCGIRDTGEMYCWGRSSSGALGVGVVPIGTVTIAPQLVKKPVALVVEPQGSQDVNWTQVTTGISYTCGIHTNVAAQGQLFCWGINSNNSLGVNLPNVTNVTVPEPVVSAVDSNNNWVEIQSGKDHTCGIRQQVTDYTLWCWGRGNSGKLGDGVTISGYAIEPQQVVTGSIKPDWSSVALGADHSCAVRGLTNTLWCWGSNMNGQLTGQIGTQLIISPTQESSLATDWIKVFANNNQTCGLKKSGTVSCWGKNLSGELGSGTLSVLNNEPTPFVGSSDWSQLALGFDHTCGIENSNSINPNGVSCWGSAEQYGIGTSTAESAVPVQVGLNWFDITIGTSVRPFVLGLRDATLSNAMYAWGNNGDGGLGNSDLNLTQRQSPLAEKNAFIWKEVSAGRSNACAIKNDDRLYCWGRNKYRPLDAVPNTSESATPTQVGSEQWLHVAHGSKHACAIKLADSSLWCWGQSKFGKLGAGSVSTTVVGATSTVETITPVAPNINSNDPVLKYMVQVINPEQGIQWTSISAGDQYTCAIGVLNTVSELYCWGQNIDGQLGIGINSATNVTTTTTQITTDTTTSAVISTVESKEKHIPTLIEKVGVSSWTRVSTGAVTSCAINSIGELYCWGRNKFGVLENQDITASVFSPELIFNNTSIWNEVNIAAEHVCARKAENTISGTLWCWGLNNNGQIGNGIISDAVKLFETSPIQVFIGSNLQPTYWKKFSTGSDSTCAIRDDDSLWCWGRNFVGQLGTGNAWKTTATAVALP